MAGVVLVAPANATVEVINFDDPSLAADSAIPNGYMGFDWSNAYTVPVDPSLADTGFGYGVVSKPSAAYSDIGDAASFTAQSGTFTLKSAYFTAANFGNVPVIVVGYVGDTAVHTITLRVNSDAPTYAGPGASENFDNWSGLTKVSWTDDTIPIIVDNITVDTAIPEPSTWAMMGLGFAGLAFAGYRSRRASARVPFAA